MAQNQFKEKNRDTETTRPGPVIYFERFMPSRRQSRNPLQHTHQAGWLTTVLTAFLMWAQPRWPGPGLWAVLGLSVGMQCLVYGALALQDKHIPKTRIGHLLATHMVRWFPWLVFVAQTTYLFLIVTVLWMSAQMLGVHAPAWVHTTLYILLVLIPVRRIIFEWASHRGQDIRTPVQDALQYFTVIVVTLLIGVLATHFVSPFGHPITGDNSVPLIFIWVIATLVILSCVVLFIDNTFSKRKRR